MSKCRKQKAVGSRQKAVNTTGPKVFYCLLLSAFCLLLSGCRMDMQDQPRYEAYESSTFFKDGLASRPIVEGTVPRGYLKADKQMFTGQYDRAQGAAKGGNAAPANAQGNANANANTGGQAAAAPTPQAGAVAAAGGAQQPAGDPLDVTEFPFPVTAEVMARGRERYEIFCAMCHGPAGDGDGMIVRRGFRQPPTYHEDRLRQARVGYFFRVITEGFGAMPSYRSQIPVQDRWAIIAYMRALQLRRMNQQKAAPAATVPSGGANTQSSGGHE